MDKTTRDNRRTVLRKAEILNTIKEITKLSNGKELDIGYPIKLRDQDGNEVYYETEAGYWQKREYEDGNETYFEDSYDYWHKIEYDRDGKQVYFEDSTGYIEDRRETVDVTLDEVCKLEGRNVRIVE